METFIQGLVVAFREGLEAFLIIAILLKFLDKTHNSNLKKSVWKGTIVGIFASFVFGILLFWLSTYLGNQDAVSKLWESIASLIAVLLITTFIVWMIRHSDDIKSHVEKKASYNLTSAGLFMLAMFMVVREGAEISIFSFAGKYTLIPILLGIALSAILAYLIYRSFVKISLKNLFSITLAYLILQAGFLLGYSIHEGLSASVNLEYLEKSSPFFVKAYDFSATLFDHKQGIIGLPLYIAFGWYSKPEWIQFIFQYSYTFALFGYWYFFTKNNTA